MTDLETRLRSTLARVAASEPVPPLPDDAVRDIDDSFVLAMSDLFPDAAAPDTARRGRRRRALVAVAALAIIGGGLTIGAAAGLPALPHSVVQALGWTPVPGAYNADPTTARILLTEAGPDGETLRLWGADTNGHGYCVSFSSDVGVDPAAPGGFDVTPQDQSRDGIGAGGCGDVVDSTYWNTFGGEPTDSCGPTGPCTFIVRVPGASTVHLEFDGGRTRSLSVGGGYTAGWLTQTETHQHPVLIGLDSNGVVMGRSTLTLH